MWLFERTYLEVFTDFLDDSRDYEIQFSDPSQHVKAFDLIIES